MAERSSSSSISGGAPASGSPPDGKEPPTAGYPLSVCKEAPAPKYLCGHCEVLLRGALRSPCGHRYCADCLAWIVRHNNKPICQSCQKDALGTINEESFLSVEKAFSDAAIDKEISELAVHCGVPGCSWTGVMKSLEDHRSTCEYALIPSHVGCGETVMMRKTLVDRWQSGCLNATPSSDCNQKVSGSKQQNQSMASSEEGCRFSRIGCPFKGNAEDRKDHEKNAAGIHLTLLLQHQLRASLHPAAAGRVDTTCSTDSEVLTGIFNMRPLQGALEVDRFSGLPLYEEVASWQTLSWRARRVSSLQSKLEACQGIASVLSKELAASRQTIMAFQGHGGLNLDMIRGLQLKIVDLQRCLARKDVALGRLEERLRSSEQASYDGTFLWKITDVHRKCYEAVCGKTCSFQSPDHFYVAQSERRRPPP